MRLASAAQAVLPILQTAPAAAPRRPTLREVANPGEPQTAQTCPSWNSSQNNEDKAFQFSSLENQFPPFRQNAAKTANVRLNGAIQYRVGVPDRIAVFET